jgi:hypothetical protein
MLAGRDDSLVPLSHACSRKSLTQSDLIDMIIAGKLRRVARIDQSFEIGSLVVDLEELPHSALPDPEDGSDPTSYLNLREVERALSTTTVTVTALLKHGLLATEVRTNPRTRRKQTYVHRNARGWRRNVVVMKDELEQNELEPVFETSGKIARYYLKEDLAKAYLLPPNA